MLRFVSESCADALAVAHANGGAVPDCAASASIGDERPEKILTQKKGPLRFSQVEKIRLSLPFTRDTCALASVETAVA